MADLSDLRSDPVLLGRVDVGGAALLVAAIRILSGSGTAQGQRAQAGEGEAAQEEEGGPHRVEGSSGRDRAGGRARSVICSAGAKKLFGRVGMAGSRQLALLDQFF